MSITSPNTSTTTTNNTNGNTNGQPQHESHHHHENGASSSSGVSSTSVPSSSSRQSPSSDDVPSQYFFDRSVNLRNQSQQDQTLIDSFSLFNQLNGHSTLSNNNNNTTTPRYMNIADSGAADGDDDDEDEDDDFYHPQTIVFNRQQFQQQWNQKYYQNYQNAAAPNGTTNEVEIHELDDDEIENPDFLDHPATADGHMLTHGDITEEQIPNEVLMTDQHYENYMIDYDADYDQYYDQHHHQQQNRFDVNGPGRPVQGYSIQEGVVVEEEEEEDDIEYYSHPGGGRGYSVGEPEVSMDLMSDAKTYGLMLPPYHQYKQNQQQQQQQQQQMIHPQFQMLQHPYMYGNPFSYNLHTILEESENETSSLQTISSMTSSNFPSLQYEPTSPLNSNQLSSLATTSNVAAKLKSSILGELSDPSAESGSSSPSSSPPLKAKFPKNRAKKSAKPNNNNSNKRSSGSNYSDISFSSSSTFSDPSISDRSNSDRSEEGEEEEEEEEEIYVTKPIVNMNPASIITQDDDSTHNSSIMLSDIDADVMSTTSKLERYFTSSLLEAQRKRNNMPKVLSPDSNGLDAEPLISAKPTPKITPIIVVEPPPDEDLDESEESSEIQITKQSQTVQQSSVVEPKKVSKFNLLSQILTALLLDPQTPTIEQLNRLNQNHLRLDWIRVLQSFTTRNTRVIQHASTIRKLLLRNLTFSELQKYTNIYLTNYRKSIDAVHIVRDHRLMGKSIQTLKSTKSQQQRVKHRRKSKESIEETQQSQIQIRINQGQSTIIINNTPPKVPQRTRKTVQIQQNPVDPNKTIYRTVLQINDFNDPALASGPGQMQNAKLSKLLNQSNPLNRNFLAKTLLNETQEDSENQIEHINSQPNGTEHSKGKKAQQKSPKNIINSSTQLLLGSLRSRSKERSKWQDQQPQDHVMIESRNQNNGKFKTISNIGRSSNGTKGHSKLSSTKSDALDQNGHQDSSNGGSKKLDRSSKGSKSFRDQRSSQSAASHNTTWDSIYGGGMKLLKNISFVRSRNRASTPKDHPERVNSRESLSSNDSHKSDSSGSNGPSRSKSLSEPNLHKSARARVRAKASKVESAERATVKSTPQLTTTTTSSSSASNYSDTTMRIHENGSSNNSDQHTATVSTPSLLYRLSNSSMVNSGLGASAPGVNAMRSISTSSLRTRRRPEPGDRVSSAAGGVGVHHLETPLNGEWQKMQTTSSTTQAEVPQYSASPSWSKSTPSLQRTTATFQVISPGSPSPANRPPSSLAQYNSIINPSSHTLSRESNDSKPNTIELLSSPASTSSTTVAGEIALSLNYDMRIGSLEISIHKCRIDVIGKQKADLYVKVYLLPDRVKANKRKTRIVKAFKSAAARSSNQLQAEFNETLRFIGPFGEFTGRRMLLSIWNSDKFGRNGPVAETVLGPLDLSMLSSGQLSELRWYRVMEPLHPTANQRASSPSSLEHSISKKSGEAAQHGQSTPTPKLKARSTVDMLKSPDELVDESKFAGTIFVAMKYQTESEQGSHHQSDYHPSQEKGSLNILIKEAQNLQFAITAANIIGSTFCKLSLQPERSKQDHEKSTPIKCPLEYSANPRWNQTFVFRNLTASELSVRSLELSVWFQVEHGMQKSGKKLFVGGVRLSSSITESTTEETTIWNQLLDRPNMWAYGEILLRELK